MSDTFFGCPKCGCRDVGFKRLDKTVDENDEEQEVECSECGEIIKQKEIHVQYVEYGIDKYECDKTYEAKSWGI